MAEGDPQAYDPMGGQPAPEGPAAAPSPEGAAPLPQRTPAPSTTPLAPSVEPYGITPDALPPDEPRPPVGAATRKALEPRMFPDPTVREAQEERQRLNFWDAQHGTVGGAAVNWAQKLRAGDNDIAKDQLEKTKLDILAYKSMPAAQTPGEYFSALSGQLVGGALSIENLLAPEIAIPAKIGGLVLNPLLRRIIAYGTPQAAIQSYSDYLAQSMNVAAGTKENLDPLQVAMALPTGFAFGTLPAFVKEGKMVRPGESQRSGTSLDPAKARADDIASISPELTPGVPPLRELPPPGTFDPGTSPRTLPAGGVDPVVAARAAGDVHPSAAMLPEPAEGTVRLFRKDAISDSQAQSIFFTREPFKDATAFIDVPEPIARAAAKGEGLNERIELPRAMADQRVPLPKAPAPPSPAMQVANTRAEINKLLNDMVAKEDLSPAATAVMERMPEKVRKAADAINEINSGATRAGEHALDDAALAKADAAEQRKLKKLNKEVRDWLNKDEKAQTEALSARAEAPSGAAAVEQPKTPVHGAERETISARDKAIEGKTVAGGEYKGPQKVIPSPASAGVTTDITPVESVQQMMTRITDMLGLTVRKGVDAQKIKGATATFDFASEIARLRETGPSGVKRLFHEIGHFVELKTGQPLTNLLDLRASDLKAMLGNDIPPAWNDAKIKREGFGEFVSSYVTNHQGLVMQYHEFTQAWQNLMEQHAPDLLEIINQAKNSFETYNTVPTVRSMLGTIRSPHAIPKIEGADIPYDVRDFMGTAGRWWHNLRYGAYGIGSVERGERFARKTYEVVFNEFASVKEFKRIAANLYRHFGIGDYLPYTPENDPFTFFKIYFGGVFQKTEQDLELGIVHFSDMERKGAGLGPWVRALIVDPATGKNPTDDIALLRGQHLNLYLVARRVAQIYREQAAGRMPLTEKNPTHFTLAQAEQVIKEVEELYPHWKDGVKPIHAFIKDQVRFELDSRLRGPKSALDLQQPWHSDYVPLLRDTKGMMEAFDEQGKLKAGGLEHLGQYTRKGSDLDVIEPLKMIMEHQRHINEQAIKNHFARGIRDLLKLFDGKAARWLGEEIPNSKIRGADIEVRETLYRAAKDAGFQDNDAQMFALRGIQELGEEPRVTMYRSENIKRGGKPILFGFDGEGERFAIQMPSTDLGRAFVNAADSMGPYGSQLHGQMINLMADVMGLGTSAYRTLTTGTLTYQLKSSVMDSFMQWLMIPEVGFFRGFPLLLTSLRSGIMSHAREDFFWTAYKTTEGFGGGAAHTMLKGGRSGALVGLENVSQLYGMSPWREQAALIRQVKAEQARLGNELRDIGIEQHRGLYWDKLQKVVAMMEKTEAWGRAGAFKTIYQANEELGRGHKYAMMDAAEKSLDITDYRQHGSGMEAMSRTIPFLASSLTGLDKFARTYKMILGGRATTIAEREYQIEMRKALLPRIGAVAVIAAGIQAWMRDDPTYQRISPETKAKYMIFRLPFVGSGQYDSVTGAKIDLPEGLQGPWVFIPKPWEQGTVFNLAEHMMEFLLSGDAGGSLSKFIKSMTYTFNLPNPFEPPFLKTSSALASGIDPYTQRPIVSASKANLPPHMQASEYTHKFYISLAQMLGMVVDGRDAKKWLTQNIPIIGGMLAAPWSPMESEFMFKGMLGDMPRELGGFYNTIRSLATGDPTKFQDIPMLRAFLKDRMAMGLPVQELYNQIKQNDGRLTQALNGFQEYMRRGDQASAQTYMDGLDDQQRDYIRIHAAQGGPLVNVLHPADRASALASAVRTLKDGLMGPAGIQTLANPAVNIKLDPSRLDKVITALSEYEAREVRNSLIIQKVKGYERQPILDSKPYFDYIAAISPEAANELSARLAQKKVLPTAAIEKYYPEARKLLQAGTGPNPLQFSAQLGSIAYQATTGGYEGGGRRLGRSAVDSQGNIIKRGKKTPVELPPERVAP